MLVRVKKSILLFSALSTCLILSNCRADDEPTSTPTTPVAAKTIETPKGVITRSYTVRGKRYRPMSAAQALDYSETGEASLYGQTGTRGAAGEILKKGTYYAAHRTLPMPCTVKVTNVKNGRSIEARVIDRGPFHRTRIIDLSYAAGKALGISGVGQVKIEVISVGKGENIVTK